MIGGGGRAVHFSVVDEVTTRAGAALPFLFSLGATALIAADHGGYWPLSWGWSTLVLASVAVVSLVLGDERPSQLEVGWVAGLAVLCGWTAASMIWTRSQTQTGLEVERSLVYAALALATIGIARRAGVASLLWGAWSGTTLVCIYALATRVFPDRLGVTDTIAGYRLATPVGYWNGLGLLAAIAILLALGLVVEGTQLVPRILAGASVPLLLATLYFTFSRGAWIALAAGLVVVVLLSPARLTFVTGAALLAVPGALAVFLAYHARPLRLLNAPLSEAVGAGHTLAWRLGLAVGLSVVATAAWALVAPRVQVPRAARSAYAAALVVAVVAVGAGVLAHYGGPSAAISHARHSLEGGSPIAGNDLSRHLLTLSSPARIDQWHVAVDEWRAHRLLGTGAGTYAEFWMAARSDREKVLDVHNLYLETMAELGLVGLVLLAAALAVPLAGAARARRAPLVAIAAAGYVAWLVHAAYDWDWELPGVTVAALVCAGAVLLANRRGSATTSSFVRAGLLAAAVVVAVVGTVGLIGNRALSRSADAAQRQDYPAAVADARTARRFAPWSSEPWAQLAGIRLAQGRRLDAVAAYRRAVAKDPHDWSLWLSLAAAARGRERAQAVARLRVLSPAVAAAFTSGTAP